MKGQLNARLPGLRATRRLGTGGGLPPLPAGYAFRTQSFGGTTYYMTETIAGEVYFLTERV